MKKITVFAGVLAATALAGTSAWASPVPATSGTHYVVNSTATGDGTTTVFTSNCNPGDILANDGQPTYGSAVDATNTSDHAAFSVGSTQRNSAGEATGGTATFATAPATGDVLNGQIICLATSTVAPPAPPSTAPIGPGGAY